LKIAIAILLCLITSFTTRAQFYLRGEIKDEKNNPLTNARIILHSTGLLYSSGSRGTFGIMTSKVIDSITVSLDGYLPASVKLESAKYQAITLKTLYAAATVQKNRLLSVTRNLKPEDRSNWTVAGETYSSLLENEFIVAKRYPETGFSLNTDKASYSNIRRFLNMNSTVPPDAVRTEELLNYFNYDYIKPPTDSIFGFASYISECPWNPESQLLSLHISARKLEPEKIPPSNLVFLIDISGSMDMPNRLPLLKSAFKLLVNNLLETDTVTIVVYGSTVGVWLQPTSGKEKEKIRKSIEELYPGGATPGESGIRTAYAMAKRAFIKDGNNRVILATDGDFNIGQASEEELEKMITQHQQWGIYLTCLGVGMGNYKDSKLEILAKKGNGNFAYLDNEQEAEKVLVKELTQTLYSVADDALFNIWFNPAVVKEYRLVGYDNKRKALVDSVSEVEGGEVGSGHATIALFEISLAYETGRSVFYEKDGLAKVTVNYRLPGDSVKLTAAYTCPYITTEFNDMPACYRFASSVAMFSAILKESKYVKRINWNDVLRIADASLNTSDAAQKEFITIVEKARKVYGRSRKKRRG
jgi:Ca-activated chloride channel family protein